MGLLASSSVSFPRSRAHSRSLLPRSLWNPSTGRALFAEVKGPGDQLSETQKVWIDVLLGAGVGVEVVRVVESREGGDASAASGEEDGDGEEEGEGGRKRARARARSKSAPKKGRGRKRAKTAEDGEEAEE